MTCLHIFDMDGTLLRGTACYEISRSVGVFQENVDIEEAWGRGEFSDNAYWQRCLPLWDKLTEKNIDSAFANAPWLGRVERVFADIAARGEYSAVITQSPAFFAKRLAKWGASFTFGADVAPGNSAGAENLVTSDDKLRITKNLLDELDIDDDRCVAYGDSLSDLALFETLSRTVAVNAKPVIRDMASVVYDGEDLWAAYSAGRELLDDLLSADPSRQPQAVARKGK